MIGVDLTYGQKHSNLKNLYFVFSCSHTVVGRENKEMRLASCLGHMFGGSGHLECQTMCLNLFFSIDNGDPPKKVKVSMNMLTGK